MRRELPLGPTLGSRRTRRGYGSISGYEILPYLYDFDNLGMKTVIPRVEIALHGVETPALLTDR